MNIAAIFEEWLIGDGCYPPLRRGRLVNLAFQCEAAALHHREPGPEYFESRADATCRLAGTVTRVYTTQHAPVAVLEAGDFRCYVESSDVARWTAGSLVSVEGTLSVDYYIWSESLVHRYTDAPDLFYPLRVTRIRRVLIPEQFVHRGENSMSFPASFPLHDVTHDDIAEVDSMLGEGETLDDGNDKPALFFLVDFSDDDLPLEEIPRTFR
jgi:hypothetical protein